MLRPRRLSRPAILASLLFASVLALLAAIPVESGEVSEVVVANFPELQRVAGEVTVGAPIPGTALRSISALVAPVAKEETTSLVLAGYLEASGYAAVALSLRGEVQAALHREGTVGALLIPDEDAIVEAFLDQGVPQFPLEASAEARRGRGGLFSSPRGERIFLGFPRYRVYFFNTTDKSASVDLYAYLSN